MVDRDPGLESLGSAGLDHASEPRRRSADVVEAISLTRRSDTFRTQQQPGRAADRAVDPRRPDVVIVQVDDDRRCRDDPSGRLRVELAQPDDVATPFALVANLSRERSASPVMATRCLLEHDRDAPTFRSRNPTSTSSSPHPTNCSQNPPTSINVCRGMLTLPVQKSNGSVIEPARTRRSVRSRRNPNGGPPASSSHCGPMSTDGSDAAAWNSTCDRQASRTHRHVVVDEPAHVATRHETPAFRAAERPEFGCLCHRSSTPRSRRSSASDDPSVEPSSTITTSVCEPSGIASSMLASSRSRASRR